MGVKHAFSHPGLANFLAAEKGANVIAAGRTGYS
jgi:hypothetical protein